MDLGQLNQAVEKLAKDQGRLEKEIDSLKEKKEKMENKEKKENVQKGWKKDIENFTKELEDIIKLVKSLKKEADSAIVRVRIGSLVFLGLSAYYINVQENLNAETYWFLFTLTYLMLLATKFDEIKSGMKFVRIQSELKPLCDQERFLVKQGNYLLEDCEVPKAESDFPCDLKSDINKFERFLIFRQHVSTLHWIYWLNLIGCSVFVVAVPLVYQFLLFEESIC